jgi:two-component system, sensor histidine kinase and response regulator
MEATQTKFSLNILLVEDNSSDTCLINNFLKTERMGITTTPCSCLTDALQLLTKQDFDVILLDLGLPESRGLETLQKIKVSSSKAPIIVLTGLDDEDLALAAMKEDAQEYLVKSSLNSETILHAIKYSIERKKIQEVQKRHTQRFSILAMGTSTLNESEDLPSIYKAISESIKRLLNDVFVISVEFINNKEAHIINSDWIEPYINEIKRISGIDLSGDIFQINGNNQDILDLYNDGKLHKIEGGIYEMSTGQFSLDNCKEIEKLLGINITYLIEFSRNNIYYGGIIIFSNQEIGSEDINIIEALCSQASLNIHRRTVDKALKLSEKRYKSLFTDSPIPKWELDFSKVKKHLDDLMSKGVKDLRKFLEMHPDKIDEWLSAIKVSDLNQAVLDLHRVSSKEQLTTNNFLPRFSRKNRADFIDRFALIAEGLTKLDMEMELFTMDGESRQINMRWAVAEGYEKTLERVLVSAMDLTEIKKAEKSLLQMNEELEQKVQERTNQLAETNRLLKQELEDRLRIEDAMQESEKQFRLLFNKMINGFALYEIILDNNLNPCDYKFVDVNPAFEILTGLKAENTVGKKISEVLPKTEDYWIEIYGHVALTGRSIEFEDYHPELNKYFKINTFCPKKGFFATIMEDITFKKQAMQAISESEEKYRMLIEKSNALICEIDTEGKFTYVNSKFKEILGYESNSLIGDYAFKICNEQTQKEFSQKIKAASISFKPQKNDWQFSTISGEWRWFSCNSSTFINRKGDTRINLVSFDITEKINIEEQLKKYSADLKELNATKDKFFSIIAHDLRNPFTTLLGVSELLTRNVYDTDKIEKLVQLINESAKQGFSLLENLLEWARTQTGKMTYNPARINLKELILENILLLEIHAANKKIKLIDNNDQTIEVFADRDMVNTILRNLLNNALKFTHIGGKISVIAQKNDDFITITVKDTGVGIPKEDLEKLFRIDIKYSSVGTAEERGSGLGLLLCKEFVDKHGGKIWVESELNKGSEFKFTIPVIKFN